jgi:hypothetical protein
MSPYSSIMVNPLVTKGDTRNTIINIHQIFIVVLSDVFTIPKE